MPRVPEHVSPDLAEEDLVLYYYGEARQPKKIRQRLQDDAALAQRYSELCGVLDAASTLPVPEPEADYGARVWTQIRPHLHASEASEASTPGFLERLAAWLMPLPQPALAGALVALVAVAFLAGRFSHPADVDVQAVISEAAISEDGRQRAVLVMVSNHLERSERLLRELANAPASGATTYGNVAYERRSAETLLSANRLYRQASASAGHPDLAALLDELERILLELARGPEHLAPADMEYIRRRVDTTLFKVEVVGSRLRQSESQTNESNTTHTPVPKGDPV
jgi:hypothetical protein